MMILILVLSLQLFCLSCISGVASASEVYDFDRLDAWADRSLQALIDNYWIERESYLKHNEAWLSKWAGFWTAAQAWDAIMDGVERTGGVASKWYPYLQQLYEGQKQRIPTFVNEYYDDMAWWALASIRAYNITNEQQYLDRALYLWEVIRGGWDEKLGGGIYWRTDKQTKNACINSPAAIIGAKLYQITGDTTHLEWSVQIYDWMKRNLAGGGLVYDHVTLDGTVVRWLFTYNQGTYMGAGVELYKSTKDAQYLTDARRTANMAMSYFGDQNGILKDEGQGDGGGFKGIFIRYLVSLIEVDPEPQRYLDFLAKNAISVGNYAFNKKDLIGPNWKQPQTGNVDMLTHVSGVMLLNLAAKTLAAEQL